MITLRNFTTDDIPVLRQYILPDKSDAEIQADMDEWNAKEHNGRYAEILAAVDGTQVVGLINFYQHSERIISIGPETFSDYRRRGYAFEAMNAALSLAKEKGYTIALNQVRTNNEASLALHRKLGFELDDYEYINRKGNRVYVLVKIL